MSWVDEDRWDPERGKCLVALLVGRYHSPAEIEGALQSAGIDFEILEVEGSLGARWLMIARRATARRELRALVEVLRADTPALGRELDLLSADAGAADGNLADVYAVQLLVGKRPLIDRARLRANLRDFLGEAIPVLVIRGDQRTGKSFSFELIQHVTKPEECLSVNYVDFSAVASGDSATDLMSKLRRRLGLPELVAREAETTRTRFATELVDDFVGQYKVNDRESRVLVIDGLNRPDLRPDVYEMVAQLAGEVFRGQLPRTQLVLTGYTGGFDRVFDNLFLVDEVEKLNAIHVQTYFQTLNLARPLPKKEVARLVELVMTGDDDIEALAGRARMLTLELLQRAGVSV